MVESSDEPSLLDRVRSFAHKAHASHTSSGADDNRPAIPLNSPRICNDGGRSPQSATPGLLPSADTPTSSTTSHDVATKDVSTPPSRTHPMDAGDREASAAIEPEEKGKKPNVFTRFFGAFKEILFSSWLNLLLVFVPVGIAVQAAGINKTVVFAVNAIAIIPLAGLLSHATESVASELGDTIGALMNITFGNAVELIILSVILYTFKAQALR